MIVGLITFVNLTNVQWNEEAGDLGAQLNGALAACFMAPVLVAVLDLSAMLILAKKTYALSGTGLSYGEAAALQVLGSLDWGRIPCTGSPADLLSSRTLLSCNRGLSHLRT